MRLIVCFIMICNGMFLQAQLVNVEKSRKEAKPGFQGHVDMNLALNQNTRRIFETGTSAHIQYHRNRHTVLILNNLNFMRVEEDDLINNGFQHLRYNYTLGQGFVTIEALTQHQYNSIRLLQRRFLVGGGPRFRMLETDYLGVYLAPLVILEDEKFNDAAKTRTEKFKGNFILAVTYDLDERINFSHTTYYQPHFAAFSEFRLSSDSGLEFLFWEKKFSFIVTFSLAYDSHPLEDIPNMFYTLRNGIKYSF